MPALHPIFTVDTYSMDRRYQWSLFRVFNFYRLILVAFLLLLLLIDDQDRFVGRTDPNLFLGTLRVYSTVIVLIILASYWRRPPVQVQVHVMTLVDLVCLILFIHASGGIASHLSILLITMVAANAILLPLYSALGTAALAFFVLTGYTFYTLFITFDASGGAGRPFQPAAFLDYALSYRDEIEQLGMLGASCFIAALLTYTLAKRTRRSEELVRLRTRELLELAELNHAIVKHLQYGIIVVDQSARIRLMNQTAQRLLNHALSPHSQPLGDVSPVLRRRLQRWQAAHQQDPKPFRQSDHLPDLTVQFRPLGGLRSRETLIVLEDFSQVTERLQQVKLAALGRMVAGIAHEIRNPLTSISYAAQLLEESADGSAQNRRLGEIIHTNSQRANQIITDVLDLSRRGQAKPEAIPLQPWLAEFCEEFARDQRDPSLQFTVSMEPADLRIHFDPFQLRQVLWNLCRNACLHGTAKGQGPYIQLRAGLADGEETTFLEVCDRGPGVPDKDVHKLFEPFFTTRKRGGTGLGLYISRELAEANSAQLQYLRPPEGGSCFRITFAGPGAAEERL